MPGLTIVSAETFPANPKELPFGCVELVPSESGIANLDQYVAALGESLRMHDSTTIVTPFTSGIVPLSYALSRQELFQTDPGRLGIIFAQRVAGEALMQVSSASPDVFPHFADDMFDPNVVYSHRGKDTQYNMTRKALAAKAAQDNAPEPRLIGFFATVKLDQSGDGLDFDGYHPGIEIDPEKWTYTYAGANSGVDWTPNQELQRRIRVKERLASNILVRAAETPKKSDLRAYEDYLDQNTLFPPEHPIREFLTQLETIPDFQSRVAQAQNYFDQNYGIRPFPSS